MATGRQNQLGTGALMDADSSSEDRIRGRKEEAQPPAPKTSTTQTPLSQTKSSPHPSGHKTSYTEIDLLSTILIITHPHPSNRTRHQATQLFDEVNSYIAEKYEKDHKEHNGVPKRSEAPQEAPPPPKQSPSLLKRIFRFPKRPSSKKGRATGGGIENDGYVKAHNEDLGPVSSHIEEAREAGHDQNTGDAATYEANPRSEHPLPESGGTRLTSLGDFAKKWYSNKILEFVLGASVEAAGFPHSEPEKCQSTPKHDSGYRDSLSHGFYSASSSSKDSPRSPTSAVGGRKRHLSNGSAKGSPIKSPSAASGKFSSRRTLFSQSEGQTGSGEDQEPKERRKGVGRKQSLTGRILDDSQLQEISLQDPRPETEPSMREVPKEFPREYSGLKDIVPEPECTEKPLPVDSMTIPAQLKKWADLDSSRPPGSKPYMAYGFLRDPESPGDNGPAVMTSRELFIAAKRFAYILRNRFGVTKRAVVCNLLPSSPERVIVDMAIVLAGGIVLCLDTESSQERTDDFVRHVHKAVSRAVCQLIITTQDSLLLTSDLSGSASMSVREENQSGKEDAENEDEEKEMLTICAIKPREEGFLGNLWEFCVDEYVDPDIHPDHPAAIFVYEDYDGTELLLYYQHQYLLQIGAQVTKVLDLVRERDDVLFNPSLPSQPWGFPTTFLYSGVPMVTWDDMPYELGAVGPASPGQGSWPWDLRSLGVNVGFLVAPVLNGFTETFLETLSLSSSLSEEMVNGQAVTKLSYLDDFWKNFERVAISGSPREIERGLQWLNTNDCSTIKVVLTSKLFGLITSRSIHQLADPAIRHPAAFDVGNPLSNLEVHVEQVSTPKEGSEMVKRATTQSFCAGQLYARSLYPMSRPARFLDTEGFVSLDPDVNPRPLNLAGFLDERKRIHAVGSINPRLTIYRDGVLRSVDLREPEARIKDIPGVFEVAVLHILDDDPEAIEFGTTDELVAVISGFPSDPPRPTEDDLQAQCQKMVQECVLPDYLAPNIFYFLDNIPMRAQTREHTAEMDAILVMLEKDRGVMVPWMWFRRKKENDPPSLFEVSADPSSTPSISCIPCVLL